MSDINEMNVGPRWYVAHTYSGYENKVKANLEKIIENRGLGHLIFDIRIPTEIVIEGSKMIALDGKARLIDEESWKDTLYREVGSADGEVQIRLIPYFAWGNREKAEMTVWMPLAR